MKFLHLVCIVSSIAAVLGGECLQDNNTNQPSSAWNQRLWSYSPHGTAQAASTSNSLVFMTYNLQSSISNACVSNPQAQAAFLTASDYAGQNEVVQGVDTRCNCNMPQIISDVTGKHERFVMTFPWRTGQYGIGLATSQNILDTQYYLYQYNGAEQRALLAVKTQPPALNGKALWFMATHIDYNVPAARYAEATQLVQWVRTNIIAKDSTASVVVVGDFNGGPDDQMYGIMKGLFKDAWEVFNGNMWGGNTYPSNSPGVRFDHVFYYTPSSVSAQVTNVEIVNTQDSDHRPLKATIKFTTSGSASPTPTVAPTAAPTAHATPAPTAKATPAPTAAPTSKATPAPTQAPPKGATSAPTSSAGTCSVSLSYNSANDLAITNTGSKAIKTIEITFSPSIPSNNWNWVATSTANVFTIPSWAFQSLDVGKTYSSSGYFTSGARPTTTVTRVSC